MIKCNVDAVIFGPQRLFGAGMCLRFLLAKSICLEDSIQPVEAEPSYSLVARVRFATCYFLVIFQNNGRWCQGEWYNTLSTWSILFFCKILISFCLESSVEYMIKHDQHYGD